jgi:transposase-like protein
MKEIRQPRTLQQAIIFFADAARCREYMVAIRWPNGVVCPQCGGKKVKFQEKHNRWQCATNHDRRQFTLKTGTVMEDSAIGLEKWLPAIWLIASAKNGISSYELHRALGVTQKTAWFMLHRIREAMKNGSLMKMGGTESGPVEVDETFVGPKPQKMHRERRLRMKAAMKPNQKAIVFGMLDRELRQVRAMVVPDVKRETLQAEILNNLDRRSKIYTDQFGSYDMLRWAGQDFIHKTVNHIEEFVRGEVHTQGIENFWSLLKRTLSGTYVAVEPYHLDRYVAEQVFRFNNRATKDNPLTDEDRFALLLSQVTGKRLTYAEVTGKVGETTF